MKKLAILMVICGMFFGCSGTKTSVAPTQSKTEMVAARPKPLGKTDPMPDIPDDWKEIKGKGWSFVIPSSFVDTVGAPDIVSVFMRAPDSRITVSMMVEDAAGTSLIDYITVVAKTTRDGGARILDARKGQVHGKTGVILVFSLGGRVLVYHLTIMDQDKAYNLDCGVSISVDEKYQSTCLNIIKSLKVNEISSNINPTIR